MFPMHVLDDLLDRAFREDLGAIDITTAAIIPYEKQGLGKIMAKEEGILAGLPAAGKAFQYLDVDVKLKYHRNDGQKIMPGDEIMAVSGRLSLLLSAERVTLNILQHLSGIATQVSDWVKEVAEFKAQIADTRKTTPGLRALEKYAVRIGGGINHRMALDSGILIKDNHIAAAGSIREAVRMVRDKHPFTLCIEVETTSLDQVKEALHSGAQIIMLDNMTVEDMTKAVQMGKNMAIFEASGNVNKERLKSIAATGVDYISCGALTHSAKSLDLSFYISQ